MMKMAIILPIGPYVHVGSSMVIIPRENTSR